MEVSESVLVLPGLPDVADSIGHLPLLDPGQLVFASRGQSAVVGVLRRTLCCVRLAVVLPTVLHLDRRQAQRLHHFMGPLAPVGRAERQDGQGQCQRGQSEGEQGAGAAGHSLQHSHGSSKEGTRGDRLRGSR